jgi:RNA polymerase sigma-70 factor (ECF subfamily)
VDVADDLERWLAEGYAAAFRTAWLILHDAAAAEDAVQEAFLRAWRFRDAVRGDDVRPWLYRVLVNACTSKLRQERVHRERAAAADANGLDELPWAGPGPEQSIADDETAAAVSSAVARLPEHLRVAVVLRYFTGLSEREIATAIHRRPGTVKSRLHEARRRLAANPALAALAVERTP